MRNLLVTLLATSSVLSFCATAGGMSLAEKDKAIDSFIKSESLEDTDVISSFKYSSWRPLSDNYVMITAKHEKSYVLETQGRCLNLHDADGIQINKSSNLAFYKNSDSISAQGGVKCYIKSIYKLSSNQQEAMKTISNS